jgi:hypothetical protein
MDTSSPTRVVFPHYEAVRGFGYISLQKGGVGAGGASTNRIKISGLLYLSLVLRTSNCKIVRGRKDDFDSRLSLCMETAVLFRNEYETSGLSFFLCLSFYSRIL